MLPGVAGVGGFVSSAVAGPTTDVVFAVQDYTTGTATGTQSFTSPTISGVTPSAVLSILALHDPANDPGETPGLSFAWGLVGGSSQHVYGYSRDNLATTSVGGDEGTTNVLRLRNNSGTEIKVATGSLVSGGIDINFSSNSSPSTRGFIVAFAGTDLSSTVSRISLGTGTSAIDINTVGFQPDAVIAYSSRVTNGSPMRYTFGIAVRDGSDTQRCIMGTEVGSATDGIPFQTLRNDCIHGRVSSADGSLTYTTVLSAFDSQGFSLTSSASAGSTPFLYIALKFNGRQCKLVDFSTPTSTGSFTITGAGFTPRFALLVLTNLEALNDHPGATSDNQGGFSICAIGSDEQWSASWRADSGAATTDTASQVSNVAIMGASATDCDAIKGTFTAWTSDGVTLNLSATQANAKKGFVLFVE